MGYHLRRQIREAIGTKLTGLASTGANVFQSRAYPLDDSELPCLLIHSDTEDVSYMQRKQERTLTVLVKAVNKNVSNMDDLLDEMCREVEVALSTDATLGGLCGDLTLKSTELEIIGEGEKPLGIATMQWTVEYYTVETAPDTAL